MVSAADDNHRGDMPPRLEPGAQSANLGEGPERALKDTLDGHMPVLKPYKKMSERRRNQSGTLEKIDGKGRIQELEFPDLESADAEKNPRRVAQPKKLESETLS
jgi:hypothetical protein